MDPDDNYPDKGEIVIGTVTEVFGQGAFITLDEYGDKKGMLHISEISLKWVRNIRDYVKEGQKQVFEVLEIKHSRGHIDLSLRRVRDSQRKNKLQEVKQRQRSERLLELVAKELKTDVEKFSDMVSENILEDYDSVYAGLEAMTVDDKAADVTKLDAKEKKTLIEFVKKSINPPFVEITGYLELESYDPNGLEIVKNTLGEINKHSPKTSEMTLSYVSAPIYRIKVKAPDYKKAETAMKKSVDQGLNYIKSKKGVGEFHREIADIKKK